MTTNTSCWDVFEACAKSVYQGCLITSVSAKDKEFHFQNWFGFRLHDLSFNHDDQGRNKYPDFSLVNFAEGYEIKGRRQKLSATPDLSGTVLPYVLFRTQR